MDLNRLMLPWLFSSGRQEDDCCVSADDDPYDPAKPEYLIPAQQEEVEAKKSELTRSQIAKLEFSLQKRRASLDPQVAEHYQYVLDEMYRTPVRGHARAHSAPDIFAASPRKRSGSYEHLRSRSERLEGCEEGARGGEPEASGDNDCEEAEEGENVEKLETAPSELSTAPGGSRRPSRPSGEDLEEEDESAAEVGQTRSAADELFAKWDSAPPADEDSSAWVVADDDDPAPPAGHNGPDEEPSSPASPGVLARFWEILTLGYTAA